MSMKNLKGRRSMTHRLGILAVVAMLATCSAATAGIFDWGCHAPEALPQVTVRYEDAARNTLIVEGDRYRAKIRMAPVAILSLETDSGNQITEPIVPGFVDSKGVHYTPQRSGIPTWKTYQGQSYKPALSVAARVNVWNAGPYYWDAHILDIPLVTADAAERESFHAKETVEAWVFDTDTQGWGTEANDCAAPDVRDGRLTVQYDGVDPWFVSPVINKRGPFLVQMRLRSTQSGKAQLYYATKKKTFGAETYISFEVQGGDAWQDITIPVPINPTFMQLRIDPPGNSGRIEFEHIELKKMELSIPDNNTVVRGELVFHVFADRLNIEFRVDPEATGVNPVATRWNLEAPGLKHAIVEGRPLTQFGDIALLGLPGQVYKEGHLEAPLESSPASGQVPRCWWVMRPSARAPSLADLFQEELNPLDARNFTVKYGRYLGYDTAAGLHTIDALTEGFEFNSAYDNPNRRIEIPVTIKGDDRNRRLICKSISHVGMLPATVLADVNGFMLPTPVLSCKNFAGEREEPDDSGYGNAFFPIDLAANEEKRFQILHLFQNWGDHMLKQVSSIRFFHIYWHLSTGVSETTCFTIPSMKLNGVWVRIPDYRPYSGPFWKGQPQHDCESWPGFLQYQGDNGEVRLVYDKTVFESIAPNLALFTMHFTSSDGAARATARVMEIPQGDESRTFLQLRYDFDKDVVIRGDARDTFRWLNVNDKQLPQSLVYIDRDGKAVAEPIRAGGHQALGREFGTEFPFVGTHGMPGKQGATYYSSMVLLRGFRARLGGVDQERAFFSAQYGAQNGNYWLTQQAQDLVIKAGDYIEAEILLLPHAESTEPLAVPDRERRYYGTEGPSAKIKTGRLFETFPATVVAENEVVALSITGGTEATPIIAKGFDDWSVPLLWVNGQWQNQQSHGGDGYQVNPDDNGKYRFTFLVKQRQGHPRDVVVTRASCSTGISRVIDRSGYPELTTDADEGAFSLRAPAQKGNDSKETDFFPMFAPGLNRIMADAPATFFTGSAKRVRQIPLTVDPAGKTVEVTVSRYDERTMELVVSGAAMLQFNAVSGSATYRLTINGKKTIHQMSPNQNVLNAEIGEGTHKVVLEYAGSQFKRDDRER